MPTKKLISKAEANRINSNPDSTTTAVQVGEKWMEIPFMPEAYKNNQGRIVRANMRMHINNHISNMGLQPCKLPKKDSISSRPLETAIISEELSAKLDDLVEDGIDVENEKVGELSKLTGEKVTKALVQQYLSR